MSRLQDLPSEIITHFISAIKSDPEDACERLVALSETCTYLRQAVLPYLWRNVSLVIDFKSLGRAQAKMQSYAQPHHPVRIHANEISINISPQYLSEKPFPFAIEELDSALGNTLGSMPHLKLLSIEGYSPRFCWPRTMDAVVNLGQLQRLSITGCILIRLPPRQLPALTHLTMEAYGSCNFDLSCFPCLSHLSLGLEDMDSVDPWQEIHFPPSLWTNLKSLSMRGYCKDTAKLIQILKRSLKCAPSSNLECIEIHIIRDGDVLDQALALFIHQPVLNLAMTVPFLPNADFCRRLAQNYSRLQKLALACYSVHGSWKWPDSSLDYADAFATMKNLQHFSFNHIEEEEWDTLTEVVFGPKQLYTATEGGKARAEKFALALKNASSSLKTVDIIPKHIPVVL